MSHLLRACVGACLLVVGSAVLLQLASTCRAVVGAARTTPVDSVVNTGPVAGCIVLCLLEFAAMIVGGLVLVRALRKLTESSDEYRSRERGSAV